MPRNGSGLPRARSSSLATIASTWLGSWRPVSPTGCWRAGSLQPRHIGDDVRVVPAEHAVEFPLRLAFAPDAEDDARSAPTPERAA